MKIGFSRCRLLPINKADDCVHSQIRNYNFPIRRKITPFFSNTSDVTRKVDAKKASCSLAPRFRWKVPQHGNMNILNDEISVMLKKLSRVASPSQGLPSSSSSLLTLVDKVTNWFFHYLPLNPYSGYPRTGTPLNCSKSLENARAENKTSLHQNKSSQFGGIHCTTRPFFQPLLPLYLSR